MRMAYARKLLEHSGSAVPVRLVVISLRDWNAGKLMEERSGVVRLVVTPDAVLSEVDWSPVFALDVLVIGGDLPDFVAALRLCLAAGASTVWGEYDDALARVEPCGRGVVALDFARHVDELLDVLPSIRAARLLTGSGVFAGVAFREARIAAYGALLGARVADRLRARFADEVTA